ncbi:hemolysin activation/secretion protein [Sphingomonas vulcanisoli]|uniref:Hemolysin activation/secretion protein n=1 Tax=Sphingomonas vulcanisoli TaxID=1658060 RepID=A0ABX0TMA6_9SPHN|nr:ShlB/FhaC/HecB family hemolysin secretion/activation protein [Sphingomonas vulcanisoli]NIJ06652.1 hemolysin activation/secretion protein [Sphingomonas vulcanisoli]
MRLIAGLFAAAALALSSLAAAAPPAAFTPPTREEVQRGAAETHAPTSRLTVKGPAAAPCPLAEQENGSTLLGGVSFDGLEALSPDTLAPAYRARIGHPVAPSDLCTIRDAATAILATRGYIAALEIPPQRLTNGGTVHFQVLMAHLVGFQVRGVTGRRQRLIEAYLRGLVRAEPFNTRYAERTLLLARDLPGMDITITLIPAEHPGEVTADVVVVPRALQLQAGIQNYGSRDTGRWGVLAAAQAAGVIAAGDQLSAGVFTSTHPRRQIVVQSAYDLRVGHQGLSIGARFTDAWIRTESESGINYKSHTTVGSALARYPFIRSQNFDLAASGGIDIIDQDLRVGDFVLTRDRLRTAFATLEFGGGDVTTADHQARWRANGTLEFRKGLSALGASKGCGDAPYFPDCVYFPTISRLEADPQAALIRFSGNAEARIAGPFSIALAPRAQYAFAPLLGYEQFSGGAYTIGRGYDPGAAIGDSGVGLATELRYGRLGAKGFSFQPFTFLDAVHAWTRGESSPGDVGGTLISIGGGLRAALGTRARADLSLALPLKAAPYAVRRGDTRILFSISTRLWPANK